MDNVSLENAFVMLGLEVMDAKIVFSAAMTATVMVAATMRNVTVPLDTLDLHVKHRKSVRINVRATVVAS
jgi:hypothetical protein